MGSTVPQAGRGVEHKEEKENTGQEGTVLP